MGIPYEEVVGTGTIATLKGKKDHPVIGLRCDIDALSIKEAKELPYLVAVQQFLPAKTVPVHLINTVHKMQLH